MRGQVAQITIAIRGKSLSIKIFRQSNDGAALIANRRDPHENVNRVSLFMAELHACFFGLAVLHRSAEGTVGAARDATLAIAVVQDTVMTGPPDYVVALVASNRFRTLVPEQYLPVAIHDRDSCLQAV
jgi:hypothetical protein